MNVTLQVSIGEFFDKLTILEIKRARITDPDKLRNIETELACLEERLAGLPFGRGDIADELAALRQVNEALWDIEDAIRRKEAAGEFDQRFIELARAVYITNDRRSDIKRAINLKLGSGFVEEKSYERYR